MQIQIKHVVLRQLVAKTNEDTENEEETQYR